MDVDEQYATAVFQRLDGDPGPSTVDIGRAVADGERHHRRVRLAGSTAVAAVAAAVAAIVVTSWTVTGVDRRENRPPAAQPTVTEVPTKGPLACSVEQLATPSGQGPKAVVSGADPTGRYIVGRTYPGGKPSTVIWVDRQPQRAPMPGDDPVLRDITSTGVAVGTSFVGDKTAAWIYADGKYTRLAGGGAEANAINEQRMIVGAVGNKPAVWRSANSQPTMLALPGPGWSGMALDVDEDGTVVGSLAKGSGDRVAAAWRPDGTLRQLPAPTAHGGPANDYTAESIRNGWVSGWAAFDRDQIRYIGGPRWNLNTGAVENIDGFFESVNQQGWTVGSATLVTDDQTLQLPAPHGFEMGPQILAYTLSDDGSTIAGQVGTRNGDVRNQPIAVIWTCKRSG